MKNFILISAILIAVITANAQWTQIGNDIDGETADDWSGCSVSINSDGTIVAIGAYLNDGNGNAAGHVRVYESNNGNWVQIGSDIDGEAAYDYSGYFVSLNSDGTIVAIGAPYNDGNGNSSGHVRVYEYSGGNWVQMGSDINGEAAYDRSGRSVSLNSDGTMVAIGAYENDGNGNLAGHVRIYEYSGGNWVQVGSDIDGEVPGDYSGISVSLNSTGTVVAIGAYQNSGNGYCAGHVRIYEYSGGNWVQMGSDIDGEAAYDESGTSVSLSSTGTIVAIGAPGNDENGSYSGHVRVYEYNGGNWIQIGNDIDGEATDDGSGKSVSLNSAGTVVAIGAIYNDGNGSNAGHVVVYEYSSGNWVQIGNDIDGETADDYSGISVNLSSDGSIVAIGAYCNNVTDAGHVRVYGITTGILEYSSNTKVSIYPNPTNGKIIVQTAPIAIGVERIEVIDIQERVVYRSEDISNMYDVDISENPKGIYFIKVTTEKGVVIGKIILAP